MFVESPRSAQRTTLQTADYFNATLVTTIGKIARYSGAVGEERDRQPVRSEPGSRSAVVGAFPTASQRQAENQAYEARRSGAFLCRRKNEVGFG